jgi:dihydrofolate reductase
LRPLHVIVAMAPDRAIGVRGGLPWRLPEDLKRFKRLTSGHAIIMGRKTFESIGRPLPNRRNIVASTTMATAASTGVEVFATFEEALERAYDTDPEPFVIGGAAIYEAALPRATDLHVTLVEAPAVEDAADTFFPKFDEARFEMTDAEPAETPGIRFIHYRRR